MNVAIHARGVREKYESAKNSAYLGHGLGFSLPRCSTDILSLSRKSDASVSRILMYRGSLAYTCTGGSPASLEGGAFDSAALTDAANRYCTTARREETKRIEELL